MLLKEMCDVLALAEVEVTIGTIPVNLHAQELSGGSQISQFEVLGELLNYGVYLC